MFENSINSYEQAKKVIPGGVDSPVRAFKAVLGTPPFIRRGKGSFIYDIDNNKYLDFVQSWGPLIFGHCDDEIEKEVINTCKNGLSFGAPTELETMLATEIVELFDNIDQIRFVSSGTEAVMSAIRLARGFTSKNSIIKFDGCYHGHSDSLLVSAGSGMATFGTPSSPGVPEDFIKYTIVSEYNNLQQLEECFKNSNDIACIIIEPIAGNMGLIPASNEFLLKCRQLCDKYNALLIFDEVMSGFRVGLKGASGNTDVKADILTFGKVIGAGMPVGAFAARNEIMNRLSPNGDIYQAGTLSGNPIAMAAGLKGIQKLKKDKNIYKKLNKMAVRLTEGLKLAAKKNNISLQTNTQGSMFGFFFHKIVPVNINDVHKCDFKKFSIFHHEMLKRGFYFACSQYEAGFICNTMTNEDIDSCLKNANEVMSIL